MARTNRVPSTVDGPAEDVPWPSLSVESCVLGDVAEPCDGHDAGDDWTIEDEFAFWNQH